MTTNTGSQTAEHLNTLINDELDDLISIRRFLHAHPELGYEEHRTTQLVQRELTDLGVDFVSGLAGGTGVLGHIPGHSDVCIGLRADMDALPITEQTGLPYASTNPGVMHACGHDGHTTMLIGAARVLSKVAAASGGQLPNSVTFCFQPAEEGLGGGERMVKDGAVDGSKLGRPVSRMFGQHGWPALRLGKVGTRPGPFLASADNFTLNVRGGGAHAAFPHYGRDPILATSAIVSAWQSIVSRNVDPLASVVLSVTKFNSGTAFNVIPEDATIGGTVRTLDAAMQSLVRARMNELAGRVAEGFQCTAELDYKVGYPVTVNDAEMVRVFEETAHAAIGHARVERIALPVMGAEDFAYYCQEVPSCFFALGLWPEGDDQPMPALHHPQFNFNDEAIALGVEIFCRLALRSHG